MRRLGTIALLLVAVGVARAEAPTISHTPVEKATVGQPLTLTATLLSDKGIFQPLVYFRRQGETSWIRVQLIPTRQDTYSATLPGAALSGDIEYYLEAYDNDGNGPSRLGSPEVPLRVSLRESASVTPPPLPGEENAGKAVSIKTVAQAPAPVPLTPRESAPPPPTLRLNQVESAFPYQPVAYGLLGGSAAAAGLGLILGLVANSDSNKLQHGLGIGTGPVTGITQAAASSLVTRERTEAAVANVSLVTAVALAASGTGLWLYHRHLQVTAAPGGVAMGGALP